MLDLSTHRADDRVPARRIQGEVLAVGGMGDGGGQFLLDRGVHGDGLQAQLLVQVRGGDGPAEGPGERTPLEESCHVLFAPCRRSPPRSPIESLQRAATAALSKPPM